MADIMLLRVSEELNRKLCLKATQMRKTRSHDGRKRRQAAYHQVDLAKPARQRAQGGDGTRPKASGRQAAYLHSAHVRRACVQTNGRRPPQCRQGNPSA